MNEQEETKQSISAGITAAIDGLLKHEQGERPIGTWTDFNLLCNKIMKLLNGAEGKPKLTETQLTGLVVLMLRVEEGKLPTITYILARYCRDDTLEYLEERLRGEENKKHRERISSAIHEIKKFCEKTSKGDEQAYDLYSPPDRTRREKTMLKPVDTDAEYRAKSEKPLHSKNGPFPRENLPPAPVGKRTAR